MFRRTTSLSLAKLSFVTHVSLLNLLHWVGSQCSTDVCEPSVEPIKGGKKGIVDDSDLHCESILQLKH